MLEFVHGAFYGLLGFWPRFGHSVITSCAKKDTGTLVSYCYDSLPELDRRTVSVPCL